MPTTDRPGDEQTSTRRVSPRGATAFPDTIDDIESELAGLDALERPTARQQRRSRRLWFATWPKLAAMAFALALWQVVYWSGWKPDYVLPSPGTVFMELWRQMRSGRIWEATGRTMGRMAVAFALSVLIGLLLGAVVARFRVARSALGSFISGLQTMPSIAWFPFALSLFQVSEGAIRFVVVLGAAPAIANGVINGADNVPPLLLRSGRILGAKGFQLFRTVTLPASLPSLLGGMKQGWAFAWRSLMAGEIIVTFSGKPALGSELVFSRDTNDNPRLMAMMLVILFIGIVVDSLFFATTNRALRKRWGLLDPAN
jgi:NitT/TauT family transport system permease protein